MNKDYQLTISKNTDLKIIPQEMHGNGLSVIKNDTDLEKILKDIKF